MSQIPLHLCLTCDSDLSGLKVSSVCTWGQQQCLRTGHGEDWLTAVKGPTHSRNSVLPSPLLVAHFYPKDSREVLTQLLFLRFSCSVTRVLAGKWHFPT